MSNLLKDRLRPAKSLAAVWAALAATAIAPVAVSAQTTLTAVMEAPLRSLDPVITTSYIVRNYGYMVYDTLLAEDAQGQVQPQMLEGWKVSEDGQTYTMTLRENLRWHDGSPVRAEDAVESIKRWIQLDKMGQIMTEFLTKMDVVDERSFVMQFSLPTDIALRAMGKPSSLPLFVMPKDVARTPISQAITSTVGSGPFRFVDKEYRPGVQAVFEKNPDYVPRNEPASGLAGGKQVKVDRVRWVAMPDAMTGVNALRSGEIDVIDQVQLDLLPLLQNESDIVLNASTARGAQTEMRFNFLQPPFNNKQVRQAAMMALNQKSLMQAQVGNPDYFETCGAVFGCHSVFPSQAGSEAYFNGDAAGAKKLLEQSGYKGEPVVLLHPTDFLTSPVVPVIAQQLRHAGFTVNVEAMDWQTVQTRRTSKRPVQEGGWSIITTYSGLVDVSNPLSFMAVASNGDKAWFGWPDIPAIEKTRMEFARASGESDLNRLATDLQKHIMDEGVIVPLGEFKMVSAMRKNLNGFLQTPVPVFWNVEKR